MLKVSIPTWIRNAAAALCGRHGAVTDRAEADCSRQTVYDHGRQVVERLAEHRPGKLDTLGPRPPAPSRA